MRASTKYYLFTVLFNLGMTTLTAYGPFLRSIGLSLGEIALVNAVFWAVIILAEIPTGMLADGRGRAWSLQVGTFFIGMGALCYLFAYGFKMVLAAEMLAGIGNAFLSGADQAWIVDALEREGRGSDRRRVFATAAVMRSALFLVLGSASVWLAEANLRLIWPPLVASGLLAAWFAHRYMNGHGEPLERVDEFAAFGLAWRALWSNRELKWLIGLVILMGGVVSFNHYWGVYFQEQVGITGLSVVWAVIVLGNMLPAMAIRRLAIPQGSEGTLIVLSVLLAGGGMLCAGWAGGYALPLAAIVVHEIGRGMHEPLVSSYVQHRVQSSYRATYGSLQSFLGRTGWAFTSFIVWLAIAEEPNTTETISLVWIVIGAMIVLGAIVLFFLRPRSHT